MVIVGNIILGFGISLFRILGLGIAPLTTLVSGVSNVIKMSFGTSQLLVGIFLLIVILAVTRNIKVIGFGTLINMIFLGYIIQYSTYFLETFLSTPSTIIEQAIFMVVAFFMLASGISIYVSAELGAAPYDFFPNLFSKFAKYGVVRMITDICSVLIGFNFGTKVGISTLIVALGTGPVVQKINLYIAKKLSKIDSIQIDSI
jgi:uncharacterized membrane protein YczE